MPPSRLELSLRRVFRSQPYSPVKPGPSQTTPIEDVEDVINNDGENLEPNVASLPFQKSQGYFTTLPMPTRPFTQAPYDLDDATNTPAASKIGSSSIAQLSQSQKVVPSLSTKSNGSAGHLPSHLLGPTLAAAGAPVGSLLFRGTAPRVQSYDLGSDGPELLKHLDSARGNYSQRYTELVAMVSLLCRKQRNRLLASPFWKITGLTKLNLVVRCPNQNCRLAKCSTADLGNMLRLNKETLEEVWIDAFDNDPMPPPQKGQIDTSALSTERFPQLRFLALQGFHTCYFHKLFQFLLVHTTLEYFAEWTSRLGKGHTLKEGLTGVLPRLRGLIASSYLCSFILDNPMVDGATRPLEDLTVLELPRPHATSSARDFLRFNVGQYSQTLKHLTLSLTNDAIPWTIMPLILEATPNLLTFKIVADATVRFYLEDNRKRKLTVSEWAAPFVHSPARRPWTIFVPYRLAELFAMVTPVSHLTPTAKENLATFIGLCDDSIQVIGFQRDVLEDPVNVLLINHGDATLVPPGLQHVETPYIGQQWVRLYSRGPTTTVPSQGK